MSDLLDPDKLVQSVSSMAETREITVSNMNSAIAVKNGRPSGVSPRFNNQTARVYIFFDHQNIPQKEKIQVNVSWFSDKENKWLSQDKILLDAPKDDNTFYFSMEKPKDGWKLGKYRDDIQINHQVRNTIYFEITDKPVFINVDTKIPQTLFKDDGKFIDKSTYYNERLGIKVKLPNTWTVKPDGETLYIYEKDGNSQIKVDFLKQKMYSGQGPIDTTSIIQKSMDTKDMGLGIKSEQSSDENRNKMLNRAMVE